MSTQAFCEKALAGLTRAERASLTGWSGRVAAAVAHLADAWTSADGTNAPRVERALASLLVGGSATSVAIWRKVIERAAGGSFDDGGRGTELLERVDAVIITFKKLGV